MLNLDASRRRRATMSVVVLGLLLLFASGCGQGLFRQYEYDQEIYLALDGSATVYVNGSMAALKALHGFDVDVSPATRVDTAKVAALFASPVTTVGRVSSSRRQGRRFVHVRFDVTDVRKLPTLKGFSWATITFGKMDGNLYRFREDLAASANQSVGDVGWTGGELVAFRLHLPSKISYHNAGKDNLRRGNILIWEQALAARLAGEPLEMEARMEPTSILYHTLWLFLGSMAAAFAMLGLIVWWVMKRSRDRIAETPAGS
jgi:hypothetical protein